MQDKELNVEELAVLLFSFLKKNFIVLSAFLCLGILYGAFKYYTAVPENQNNLFARSEFVPLELLSNEVASLNSKLERRNYSEIAAKLAIPEEEVVQCKEFKFYPISSSEGMFYLKIVSAGIENVNENFANGFLASLESNSFISDYLDKEKELILGRIAANERELEVLEGMQNVFLGQGKFESYNSIISNPSIISAQVIAIKNELNKDKQQLEKVKVYSQIDNVEILSYPSLKMHLLSAAVVSVFIGLCFLILRNFLKNLRD
ncbi:MAG: hypothetical protein H6579_03520 [Chitinophagales bacterium]|nr:hypothetical protein [Chitinophagales bacterium]